MKFTVVIQALDRVNFSDLGDTLTSLVYPQILATLIAFTPQL